MLIGLFIANDEKVASNLVDMLGEKFQGIEFINLRDLNQDLNMATLAKGSFDKIIIYVKAFNGVRSDRIVEELTALKEYKELRARNVNIIVVDKLNPNTNRGILEMAYRKFFGSFVDCKYCIKNEFTGSTLVDLIREVDVQNDYFENKGKPKDVNKKLVNALSSKPTQEVYKPQGVEEEVEEKTEEIEEEEIEEEVREEEIKEEKKKKKFSFFGSKKFNIVKPDISKMKVVSEIDEEDIEEHNSTSQMEVKDNTEDSNEDNYKDNYKDNFNGHEENTQFVEDVSDEEISDYLYGSNESTSKPKSRFNIVEPAISRNAEVVPKEEKINNTELKYKNVSNPFESTSVFNIPTELSNDEALYRKQLELKELELKARMLEAQAQIKSTELETAQRSALVSPVRIDEEKVTGYINSNRGRAKLILVTGEKSSGKTTVSKFLGEILKESSYTLDIDLDFEGRTLSESFDRLNESDLTRLGLLRSLRDLNKIEQFIAPIDGNLDVLGTFSDLSEAEENSLSNRLDTSLIQSMLRKVSNSGLYGFVVVDCPLDILKKHGELLDVSDYVIWTSRGSRHGISSMLKEFNKDFYDEFFLNKLTIVLNGENNQIVTWKRFFNTESMWSDDIADSLGAILPYIDGYDEYFWNNITGLELKDFRNNILEVLDLS